MNQPLDVVVPGILIVLALSLLTPYFYFIPRATLSSVIICAVLFMVEVGMVSTMWKSNKRDLIPALVTFFACLGFGVELGILIGIAVDISFLLYFNARPRVLVETLVTSSGRPWRRRVSKEDPNHTKDLPVVVNCRHVQRVDFTAAQGIHAIVHDFVKRGRQVLFFQVCQHVVKTLSSAGNTQLVFVATEQELIVVLKAIITPRPRASSPLISTDGRMSPRIGMWPDLLACQPGTSVVLVGGDTGDAGCGHDLLIVIKGYSRRNLERKSNQVLEELDTLCKSVKLKMAPAKTTYMLFKGRWVRDPTIKVGRKSIRRSLTVRYLGVTPDENRNFTAHMEQVTGKTLSVINKTISMRQRRFYLPMRIIKTYHQNILLSIVSYEACIWAHRLTNVVPAKVIQGQQRNILLRLTGAYRTVATDSPSVALGVWTLDLLIRKKGVTYWIKMRNMERVRLLTTPDVTSSGEAEIVLFEGSKKELPERDPGKISRRSTEGPDLLEMLKPDCTGSVRWSKDRLKEAQGRIRRDFDNDSDTDGGTDADTSVVSAGRLSRESRNGHKDTKLELEDSQGQVVTSVDTDQVDTRF
uniref:SLC26A/SulP transporter domain-containing protein n=1 Tax=Timema douglasi TaxID=61478 RepID=A0A7R8VSJ9_TIMDO|nr:unnamed protein product [Timema douglasi]